MGERCQALALLPASLEAGYRHETAAGGKSSSWGGGVLWSSDDKLWHMCKCCARPTLVSQTPTDLLYVRVHQTLRR